MSWFYSCKNGVFLVKFGQRLVCWFMSVMIQGFKTLQDSGRLFKIIQYSYLKCVTRMWWILLGNLICCGSVTLPNCEQHRILNHSFSIYVTPAKRFGIGVWKKPIKIKIGTVNVSTHVVTYLMLGNICRWQLFLIQYELLMFKYNFAIIFMTY